MNFEMPNPQSPDPLHGITLAKMLEELVDHYGWENLSDRIPVRCFMFEPSLKSSLHFLRRTPWARAKIENLYRHILPEIAPPASPPPTPASEQPPEAVERQK